MRIQSYFVICFVSLLFNHSLGKSIAENDESIDKRLKRNVESNENGVEITETTTDESVDDIEEDVKSEERDKSDGNNDATDAEDGGNDENDSEESDSIEESQEGIKLLVILVDGFRWDYVSRLKSLKGFPLIAENGVSAQYVKPIFPANSYPNWYSIVTGLYAESHGMIQNYMYDEERDDLFLMSPHPNVSHNHWWSGSEPLWIRAQKSGIKTAMYLWDGCQVRIGGTKASICHKYRALYDSNDANNQTRVYIKQILDDFSDDKYRLALLYHEYVDHTGHSFGPLSRKNKQSIRDIDDIIYDLYEAIKERQLEDDMNVVIVSDHGMIQLNDFQVIRLEDIIDYNDVELHLGRGSVAQILPEEGKEEEVYQQLRQAEVKGLNVYKKDNIPERFHYKNNDNVLPILLTVDRGYYMAPPNIKSKVYPFSPDEDSSKVSLRGGGHGFDADYVEEMRGVMYAFGPQFRKNFVSEPLEQVDHYNLFCHLLGITPNPNNGSESKIESLLKDSESEESDEGSDEHLDEGEDKDEEDDGVSISKLHSMLIFISIYSLFFA